MSLVPHALNVLWEHREARGAAWLKQLGGRMETMATDSGGAGVFGPRTGTLEMYARKGRVRTDNCECAMPARLFAKGKQLSRFAQKLRPLPAMPHWAGASCCLQASCTQLHCKRFGGHARRCAVHPGTQKWIMIAGACRVHNGICWAQFSHGHPCNRRFCDVQVSAVVQQKPRASFSLLFQSSHTCCVECPV